MSSIEYLIILFLTVLLNIPCSSNAGTDFSPILVLATNANFGTYAGEILKAEGFNEFIVDSLTGTNVNNNYLKHFDLVILSETAVTQSQKEIFSDYVKAGGNLIAFRPDKLLSEIFGIIDTRETVKEGYIKIDTLNEIGIGLIPVTIQFHGMSDVYKLKGGNEIAKLYYNDRDSSGFPSLVVNKYGKGHTAAFSYNLPKSIVYTRQGNPDWAGEERDKVDGPTATDLFYPRAGETQWNNPQKIAIPQADEQMRLLSHVIEKFNTYKKPLPRFWYFPDQYKCIFIFTIDGEDSKEEDINNEIIDVQSKCGNATLYEIGTYIAASTVNTWRSNGNEVAIHYNDVPHYANPTYSNMKNVLDTMSVNFRDVYGISPKTVRNHWVVWCSEDSLGKNQFAEQAILEAKYGLGFDCNYYQFGGNKVYPNWIGDVGHFTGSGIPMKFADADGTILNIYQSNTQLPDETWLKENIESKSKALIDRSLDEENFTYINANYHTWYWNECKLPGLSVLDYCNIRGVPIWTAERVYEFLRMKDEASFSNLNWSENQLTFKLSSSLVNLEGLTFLLPAIYGNLKIGSVKINRQISQFTGKMIKGYEYALITVTPGKIYEITADYR
jgi:hypothetical protein